jgi:Mrp family chromosome partitioning ATPase/capsular polysaccharide biosynthesis protein
VTAVSDHPLQEGPDPGFREPAPDSPGGAFVSYLRAIRSRPLLILAITLTMVGASAAWLLLKDPVYRAEAQILVSPLPEDDPSFVGLPLIRSDGDDTTRAVATAASLARSRRVAGLAADHMNLPRDVVSSAIQVEPQADTNLLNIIAETSDAELAKELANEYAMAFLGARRRRLEPLIAETITSINRQLGALPNPQSLQADVLRSRLAALEAIENGSDPTLSVARRAREPDGPEGPPASYVLALALIGGLAVGCMAAVLTELLTPRGIHDESDLIATYPLPVLVRVPLLPAAGHTDEAVAVVRERFRSLRTQLDLPERLHASGDHPDERERASGGVVLVTSGTRGDGRTTTALNLARAAALSQQSAIVADLDLRNPRVADLLGVPSSWGLVRLLSPDAELDSAVVRVPGMTLVSVMPAPPSLAPPRREALLERMVDLLPELRTRARWVIIDTPPLPLASDALPLLRLVDGVIAVARPGNTTVNDLTVLREMLDRTGAHVNGYVVIGRRAARTIPMRPVRGPRTEDEPLAAPVGW